MADAPEPSISFTGQKRRVRPVRRVQVSTHFDDLDVKPISLATPPPPAPEPLILTEAANTSDLKLPQVKEAGYAAKSDEFPIDEFAFLTGIVPKPKNVNESKTSPVTSLKSDIKSSPKAEVAKTSPLNNPEPVGPNDKETRTVTPPPEPSKASQEKETKGLPIASKEAEKTQGLPVESKEAKKVQESQAEKTQEPKVSKEVQKVQGTKEVEKTQGSAVESFEAEKVQETKEAEKIQESVTPKEVEKTEEPIVHNNEPEKTKEFNDLAAPASKNVSEPTGTTEPASTPLPIAKNTQEMTEEKKTILPAKSAEVPPVPARYESQDRRSFISIESQAPGLDFNDSDAGAIKKRTSLVDSEAPNAVKRSSLTDSSSSSSIKEEAVEAKEVTQDWRESLKPRMLPVLPIAQPAAKQPENFTPSPPIVASNLRPSSVVSNNGKFPLTTGKDGKTSPVKLATYQPESEELGRLRENFDKQAQLLEKERQERLKLEHQFEALKSKCEAQEEALRYKNEKVAKMEQEFIGLKNEVTGLKMERDRIQQRLQNAEAELNQVSDNNAVEFIQKSDEVIKLKEQLDNLAFAISEKDKAITALQTQLKESQDTHINVIFDSLNALKDFDDDFITAVEAEILKMETLLKDEHEYSIKLQQEVEGEYNFWKKTLSSE